MNDVKKRGAPALLRAASSGEDAQELAAYSRQLAGYPALTVPQERQLVQDLLSCEPARQSELRRRLIEGTLWRALSLARRYQGLGVPLSELIGEANLALMRAAQVFVPASNRLFRHSASGSMQRALAHVVEKECYRGLLPPVEQDEGACQGTIAPDLVFSLEDSFAEEDLPKGLWSTGDDEDSFPTSLLDVLANSVAFSTGQEAFALDQVALERLGQALAALPPPHRQALELRYRIGEEATSAQLRTRREIGELMEIDQQSVGRLEERAIRAIQHFFLMGTTGLGPASCP